MNIDKQKLKIKLQEELKREPTENEIINSLKDKNVVCEILYDEIENIYKILKKK